MEVTIKSDQPIKSIEFFEPQEITQVQIDSVVSELIEDKVKIKNALSKAE